MNEIDKIIGRNPILEALRAGRAVNKLLVSGGLPLEGGLREIIFLAREKGIPVQEVPRSNLDRLAGTRSHQGVIALTAPYSYADMGDLLHVAQERGQDPFLIVLDRLEDPRNLGAIIRTADAAGAHGVIVAKHRAVSLTPAAEKTAAGAASYVKVARVSSIPQVLEALRYEGLWTIGAAEDGDAIFWDVDLTGPLALVIGGEDRGLSRLSRARCDLVVRIPMLGRVSSLNASVAASLLMYEVMRQRRLRQLNQRQP